MSFYGNITNMSRTHFQFDKIYPNRYTMDISLDKDEVFAGRFVLVEYDTNGQFSESDVLIGYKTENDEKVYADAECLHPYYYATLSPVSHPIAENWNSYFLKYGSNFPLYFKLPSADYFNAEEKNYYKIKDNYSEALIPFIVTRNQIVRIKNSDGTFSSSYYQCVNTDLNPLNEDVAIWEQIDIEHSPIEYFQNYSIDKKYYGESKEYGPNSRGYDATVWQKVYSSGVGKYVLIAHLNALIPTFSLIADAPSTEPSAPYIANSSTDMLYSVHVPSHWGFEIKEAQKITDPLTGEITYEKSDQQLLKTQYEYDEYNNIVNQYNENVPVEIYFNKNGAIRAVRNYDDETINEILITPTGESGRVYFDSNGQRSTIDTYEIAIHLPVIGNLISDFYDIFYTSDRNLDTTWYDGEDANRINGNPLLNGKTRDLNSVAGLINTFQDRLGQIIIPLESMPSQEQINGLSEDYIYSFYNQDTESIDYYRVGKGPVFFEVQEYEPIHLEESDYESGKYYIELSGTYFLATSPSFSSYNQGTVFYRRNIFYTNGGSLEEEQYERNTYYVKTSGTDKLIPATESYSYYQQYNNNYENVSGIVNFYKKNVRDIKYVEVDLMQYLQGTYFYKRGNDYILDMSVTNPSFPNDIYYTLTATQKSFSAAYTENSYFYEESIGEEKYNYILAREEIPDPTKIYYSIEFSPIVKTGEEMPYQPNKYYYQDLNGQWVLDNSEFVLNRQYYYVPYDTSQLITVFDIETQTTVVGYALDIAHAQPVNLKNWELPVYAKINGNYIDISTLDDLVTSYSEYIHITNITAPEFFLPNKYYFYNAGDEETGEGRGYFLADSFLQNADYYELTNILPTPKPFYETNKYYYFNESRQIYDIDSEIMTVERQYYIESGLYVLTDSSGRFDVGHEWKDQALFVPASVTLATKQDQKKILKINGIDNGESSINGNILRFNSLSDFNNYGSRDKETINGALNSLKDSLKIMTKLYPGRILYVNDFGQITASTITYNDLKQLFNRVENLEQD